MLIHFLHVSDCQDCEHMLLCLQEAIKESGLDVEVVDHCCDEDDNGNVDETALKLAINNGLDDLPACIIGRYTFVGKDNYDYGEILEAIEKTWKQMI